MREKIYLKLIGFCTSIKNRFSLPTKLKAKEMKIFDMLKKNEEIKEEYIFWGFVYSILQERYLGLLKYM